MTYAGYALMTFVAVITVYVLASERATRRSERPPRR